MPHLLSSWPWSHLGTLKYALYAPFVANAFLASSWDSWWLRLLALFALRGLVHQLWCSFSNLLFLTRRRRIVWDGVDFAQIDKEWDWDNFLILQAFVAAVVYYAFPELRELPRWKLSGCFVALLLHIAVSEPLFYFAHILFHRGSLFEDYHSVHHSIPVPQPFTAGFLTPLEHMVMVVVMGVPLLGTCLLGLGSDGMVCGYVLLFDFLRCMGHCNVEVFPHGVFENFPFLRYLIYTPTYLSLHHAEKYSNFCLFMPIFDVLGGTLNNKSWNFQKEISSGKNEQVPDFVFLIHSVDIISEIHAPFVFRSFSSNAYSFRLFLLLLWPASFVVMLAMWAWSKTFLISFYNLRGKLHQLWAVPRVGFQYFLPFGKDSINKLIELAILRADKMGVKVIILAGLNKNEALNGGGTLFVNKYPNLRVRVVHGNTLTAAVILNEIPKEVKEVFLTGATSKLGRAIALYLCRKNVRVLMLTLSSERFQKIQNEALPEHRNFLVQVTKYQVARNCKRWIVGKWLTSREQQCASPGTHFHQLVVPPITEFRRDCTYGKLAAMRWPKDLQGFGMCEYTLERGAVHACHVGGVVHFLEGWDHHEVGAIDVDRIDVVWEAALKHGMTPL